jgi:hypothetical protein
MGHDARSAPEAERRKQDIERRPSRSSESAEESRGAALGRYAILIFRKVRRFDC